MPNTTPHTCHGAIFAGAPRALAEAECLACSKERTPVLFPHIDGHLFTSYRWSSTGATVECWCGEPATLACPIDPEVTSWDEQLRMPDNEPAMPYCDEHARDGYTPLGDFARGAWPTRHNDGGEDLPNSLDRAAGR